MQKQSILFRWLVLCVVLFAALWTTLKYQEREHWLSLLPSEFAAQRILYVASNEWGFGPGGNETGVVLYEIPQEVADAIGNGTQSLPQKEGPWESTPLHQDQKWLTGEGALPQVGPTPIPRLFNYLNQYGFGIKVQSDIENMINLAVSKPGSFYTYTRTGIIIVMPKEKRVALAFAG